MPIKRNGGSRPPVEGIFYVVFLPDGWRLLTRRFDEGEDAGHTDWWAETLARHLAAGWAKSLGVTQDALAD